MFLAPRDYVASAQAMAAAWSLSAAQDYTRWLATNHYENFHVVSFLLPRKLHQDFYNVYSYCRWADDLGDEMGETNKSLRLLEWWRGELDAMYLGHTTHPVFMALRPTVQRHGIPQEPFADLIRAFIQDQTVTRYATYDDLFQYCRRSANPVGRLVLYLCGYSDPARQKLSDATCTALQLANFWQDVSVDLEKDRVYIPLEAMERHGYNLDDLYARRGNAAFRAVMRDAVDRARALFLEGLPLSRMVDRRLALDLELFSRGGLCILRKIEEIEYDVLDRRPSISKPDRALLLLGALIRVAFGKAA